MWWCNMYLAQTCGDAVFIIYSLSETAVWTCDYIDSLF